jgi:hypothetical protein
MDYKAIIKHFSKYSETELKKILFPEIGTPFYKHKYFCNNYAVYKVLYIDKQKKRSQVVYKSIMNDTYGIAVLNLYTLASDLKPFSYEKLQEFKFAIICEKIDLAEIVTKKAIEIFGKDRVDDSDKNYPIIYYPKIVITNSSGLSHTMLDIYVQLEIESRSYIIKKLNRTTLTSSEYRQNYIFSHGKGDINSGMCNLFCYGNNGNPVYDLGQDAVKFNLLRNIEMWLYSIELYLSWESLEGVPYKSMFEVIKDTDLFYIKNTTPYLDIAKINKLMLSVISELSNLEYHVPIGDILLKGSTKEELKTILNKLIEDSKKLRVNEEGNLVVISSRTFDNIKDEFQGKYVLTFKGQDKHGTMINTDQEAIDRLPLQVHPFIQEQIEKTLESLIKKTLLENKLKQYGIIQ